MNLYNTGAVVGLATLPGPATLAGSAVAQDPAHGANGGTHLAGWAEPER